MLALSIRLRLQETPLFTQLKAAGQTLDVAVARQLRRSGEPQADPARPVRRHGRQAVVWYQGQFQALFFMQTRSSASSSHDAYLDRRRPRSSWRTPFFLVFGRLSDRIGRKPIILGGCLIAALTYFPIYNLMLTVAHRRALSTRNADGKSARPDGRPTSRQPDDPAADRARLDPGAST